MIAQLQINAAVKSERTYLKNVFFTTPFKVANITEDKTAHELQLMLMSSSPGVLDGDQYQLEIELEECSAVKLQTQSYQRLFNMKNSARQEMLVRLATGSSFHYLPHPAVPHKQSSFYTTNRFYLSGDCRLIFGEILTCGRKLNGEVFSFSKYHAVTEVFLHNKLVIRENLLVDPAAMDVNAIGQLEGFTHQASLICLDAKAVVNSLSDAIHELLSAQTGILFGVTAAPVNGILVRLLGQKAEQLHDCLKAVAAIFQTIDSNKRVTQ